MRTRILCGLALALVFVVTVSASATELPSAPPTGVPLELLLGNEAVATPAPPAAAEALDDVLEEELFEEKLPMATVCTEMCPGDPSFGIAPYTPSCTHTCTPCYENGQLCGFLCDGWGLNCFPQGCIDPSC